MNMENAKRIFSVFIVVVFLLSIMPMLAFGAETQDYVVYNVINGDSLWKISSKFNTTIQNIRDFNSLNSDYLNIGQKLNIPVTSVNAIPRPAELVHVVVSGDTLWKLSVQYSASFSSILQRNGLNNSSVIYIGQKVVIPLTASSPVSQTPVDTKPSVTYTSYFVKSGDTVWSIAENFGIPMTELFKVNGLNENSMLYINQKLSIPVHNIPITPTNGLQYGEYLDWWTQTQYVFPINKTAKITDFYTGKTWYIKRTIGANHADIETLTAQDTQIMKSVWGGNWSWVSRPVIVEVDGRRIAAGMAGMPHAGVDGAPAGQIVNNRSGNYGTGPNLDYIKGNEMDGHVDIHFLNSTTHNTGEVNPTMQECVKIAAGVK